jgi:hypothetical protein
MFLRLPAPVLGMALDGFDSVGCLAEIKHKMTSLRRFKHLRLLTGHDRRGQVKRRAVMPGLVPDDQGASKTPGGCQTAEMGPMQARHFLGRPNLQFVCVATGVIYVFLTFLAGF